MAAARRLSGASWRVAVRASSRLNVDFILSSLQLSVCQHTGGLCFCYAGIEQTSRSGREAGLGDDGVRDSCEPGSHLPPIVGWPESCSAIAMRNGRFVGAGVSGNAGVWSDGMKNGVLPPGIVFQSRGLAAKAKKAKSSKYSYSCASQSLGWCVHCSMLDLYRCWNPQLDFGSFGLQIVIKVPSVMPPPRVCCYLDSCIFQVPDVTQFGKV